MRKSKFLSLAACALVLASCSQNEIDQNSLPKSKKIGFDNLNGVQTKAANDASDAYGVYGLVATSATEYYSGMENLQVNGDNSYTETKYWPSDGSALSFYAYAPYNGAGLDLSGVSYTTDFQWGVNYTVQPTADVDLTFGKGKNSSGNNSFTATDITASLEFKHMLSKIVLGDVTLDQPLLDAGYTVDASNATISIMVNSNKGNSDIASASGWTSLALVSTGNVIDDLPGGGGDQVSYSGGTTYYIMPQDAVESTDKLRIQLKGIKITDGASTPNTTTTDLKATWIGGVSANAFQAGYKYTVNFKISGDAQKPGTTDPTDPDEGGGKLFQNAIIFGSSVVDWSSESLNFTL